MASTATWIANTTGKAAAAALDGTEIVRLGQVGASVKLALSTLKTFFSASPTLVTPVIGAATGTSLATTAALTAFSGTAIPAGGTAGSGIKISSVANFGIFFGSGAPTLAAAQGSLYLRSDGSTVATRLYVNTDGGTTWTAFSSVG